MVNTEEFVKRLEQILQFYGLSASIFAERVGVQRSSLSHLLSGRNKPSLDFVMKICDEFSEVDLYWFLLGEGRFPKSGNKNVSLPLFEDFSNKESEKNLPSTLFSSEAMIEKTKDKSSVRINADIEEKASYPNLNVENYTNLHSQEIHETQNSFQNNQKNTKHLNQKPNDSDLSETKFFSDVEVEQMIIIFRDGSFKSYKPRS